MNFEKSEFEKNLEKGNKIVNLAMDVFATLVSGIAKVEKKKMKEGIELGYSIKFGNASKGISSVATIFNNTNKNVVPKERRFFAKERLNNSDDLKCLDGDFVRILNHPENETIELADVVHKEKKYFKYGDALELAQEMCKILNIVPDQVMENDLTRIFYEYKLEAYLKRQAEKDKTEKDNKK